MNYEKEKIKIIFIGTPDFGIPCFRALMRGDRYEIITVVTQPDMPVGRKQVLTPSIVKQEALKYNIPILQPKKINKIAKKIKALNPDLIFTVAYAQLIPEEILKIPKYGCINLHGSLLPKYRGAAVVQAPILNGDKITGVTLMKMDKGLDTGPIIAQKKCEIKADDTAGTLYDKLSLLGAELLIKTLPDYIAGKIKLQAQDKKRASYLGIIKKKDGLINWQNNASKIELHIKAMDPWPSAWTNWQNKKIKILKVQKNPLQINSYKPGKTFIYNSGLAVQTGKNSLIITILQLEGKKPISAEEFLKGHKNFIGSILN